MSTISWNANGLSKHKYEFQCFLEAKNIDIALISETHFNPTSHSKIFGYQVYHTCHPDGTAHAGTAIYIKNNLSYHQLAPHSEPYLQVTTI
jgi:exonuclease III